MCEKEMKKEKVWKEEKKKSQIQSIQRTPRTTPVTVTLKNRTTTTISQTHHITPNTTHSSITYPALLIHLNLLRFLLITFDKSSFTAFTANVHFVVNSPLSSSAPSATSPSIVASRVSISHLMLSTSPLSSTTVEVVNTLDFLTNSSSA